MVRRAVVQRPAWSQSPSQGMLEGQATIVCPSFTDSEGTPPWVTTVQPAGTLAVTA